MKKNKRVLTALGLILFAAAAFSLFQNPSVITGFVSGFFGIFSTITAGLFVAFVLNLPLVFIEKTLARIFKKFALKHTSALRTISIVLTFALTFGFVALLVTVAIPLISEIVSTVIVKLPELISSAGDWAGSLLTGWGVSDEQLASFALRLSEATDTLMSYLSGLLSSAASLALSITTGLFSGIANVVLAIALCAYTLSGKERIIRAVNRLMDAYLPKKLSSIVNEVSGVCFNQFSLFFRGQITEAMLLGIMCLIGMLIFGFPSAGVISLLVGVSALVPVLGPWFGSITSILLIVITDPLKGLFFAIYILVLQEIEDNVLYPRIVGRSMGLPGILVLCAVIIGAKLMGIAGMIMSVPVCGTVYTIVKRHTGARLSKTE